MMAFRHLRKLKTMWWKCLAYIKNIK